MILRQRLQLYDSCDQFLSMDSNGANIIQSAKRKLYYFVTHMNQQKMYYFHVQRGIVILVHASNVQIQEHNYAVHDLMHHDQKSNEHDFLFAWMDQ